MPPKEDDVIRLFDRGDFFSVHGPDAIVVAATVYKTQSVVKMLGKGKDALPSCTLNMTAGKNFLREALTVKQLKIEIWGGGSSKKHSWKSEKQVGYTTEHLKVKSRPHVLKAKSMTFFVIGYPRKSTRSGRFTL